MIHGPLQVPVSMWCVWSFIEVRILRDLMPIFIDAFIPMLNRIM